MGEVSDMSFWALTVPGNGKPSKYEVEQTGELAQYVHVTNVALPHNAGAQPHALTITRGEDEFTIATLSKATHPQHNLDFILDQTVIFKCHGPGPVHLLGYQTIANVMDLHGDEDESEFDEDEDEDEDEDAPELVPLANGKPGKGVPTAAKVKPNSKPAAKQDSDDDEDEDEGEDEDEDEGEDEDNSLAGVLKRLGGTNDVVMEYNSDLDEGDEGEDDEGEDDEDEDEDEEEEVPIKVPAKRVPQPAAATPAAKKSKPLESAPLSKPPQSAPPKVKPTAKKTDTAPSKPSDDKQPKQAKPTNAQEYESALVQWLKSKPNKTGPLSALGTAVHKPDGVPKLGQFVKSRDKLFKIDSVGQNVTLIG